jgi:hypothetical protein
MCTTSDSNEASASVAGISQSDTKLYQSLLSQGVDASDMTFARPGIKVTLHEPDWNALQLETELGNTYPPFVKDVTLYSKDPTDGNYKAVKCDHRVAETALNYGITEKWSEARSKTMETSNNANAIVKHGVCSLEDVDVPIGAVTKGTVNTSGKAKKVTATIVSPGGSNGGNCVMWCKATVKPNNVDQCIQQQCGGN